MMYKCYLVNCKPNKITLQLYVHKHVDTFTPNLLIFYNCNVKFTWVIFYILPWKTNNIYHSKAGITLWNTFTFTFAFIHPSNYCWQAIFFKFSFIKQTYNIQCKFSFAACNLETFKFLNFIEWTLKLFSLSIPTIYIR
jgi:hypothetical protein